MKNFKLKSIAYLCLFGMFIIVYSCQKDDPAIENETQLVISKSSAKAKKSKIDVCHNNHIINISSNAVLAHQGHGDAVDMDGDGYFDIDNSCSDTDCDDNDPAINPGATEIVYNGIDDDCDPGTLDDDLDQDGFLNVDDCNDNDPNINPGAEEVCINEIDDNCNGEIDEGCVVLPAPIAYYPFNGNANDESGNGYDGTINGAILTSDRFGNTNSAYSFNGVQDNIYSDVATDQLNDLFTVSAWINANDLDKNIIFYETIVSSYTGGGKGWLLYLRSDNNGVIRFLGNNTSVDPEYSLSNLESSNWYHIVGVSDGTSHKLYIDGILVSEGDPNSWNNSGSGLTIGATDDSNNTISAFDGIIDEVRLYDVGLSATEIEVLYNLE